MWRAVGKGGGRLEPTGCVRFGEYDVTASELDAMCRRAAEYRIDGPGQTGAPDGKPERASPGPTLDEGWGLRRVVQTGEIVPQEPPRRRR